MSENAVFAAAGRSVANGFRAGIEIAGQVKHRVIISSAIGARKRRVFSGKLIKGWSVTSARRKAA
jgi:hypothetical protein